MSRNTVIKPVLAYETETVEIRWHLADGSTRYQRVSLIAIDDAPPSEALKRTREPKSKETIMIAKLRALRPQDVTHFTPETPIMGYLADDIDRILRGAPKPPRKRKARKS